MMSSLTASSFLVNLANPVGLENCRAPSDQLQAVLLARSAKVNSVATDFAGGLELSRELRYVRLSCRSERDRKRADIIAIGPFDLSGAADVGLGIGSEAGRSAGAGCFAQISYLYVELLAIHAANLQRGPLHRD